MSNSLHTVYRPHSFKEVIGQDHVLASLQKTLDRDGAHTFLFIGPSGCGKTTLARVCANYVRCEPGDIIEVDAATKTGIDAMREVQQATQFSPLGASEARVVIIDEVHRLSAPAWSSLLKVLEEPPSHVYWFLCTTEAAKLPTTIKTRSTTYKLNLIGDKDLGKIFDKVCKAEDIDLPGDVGDLIIKESGGSARQMLVYLEQCRDVTTKREAAALMQKVLDTEPVIELCRMLGKGGASWVAAMAIVTKLKETENPEAVRIIVSNYFASAAFSAKSPKDALFFVSILDAFAHSFQVQDGFAPLVLAIGRVMLGE